MEIKSDVSLFGKNIQTRRDQLGLTQAQLAERVWEGEINNPDSNVVPSAAKEQKRKNICNYENGKFPKDGKIYYRLCKVLDCDMDYLFGLIDSPKHIYADIQEQTCISKEAAEKLKKNAGGYWQALSAVLESEVFWQFLKLMETYKAVETSGNDVGEYVNKRIESAAKTLLPEPMREDMDIFNDGFYQTICSRYCWLLLEEYKKSKGNSLAK